MPNQKTIQSPIRFKGIGIHSGKVSDLVIRPARANHGIVFEKIEGNKNYSIPTQFDLVDNTLMCTTISLKEKQIKTVEHLLSAIYALGIDNALIQVNGDEVPILDGSSAPFVYGLNKIGITEQSEKKRYLKVLKKIKVEESDCYAMLEPFDGFKLSFEINFDHPYIQKTECKYSVDLSHSIDEYVNHVAMARTFGFTENLEWLKKNNLAKGASDQNAIVLNKKSILKNQSLRDKAEFVQHKLLDAIGDLALCGFNLKAKYDGYKAGHKLNNKLLKELFKNSENYQIIS